MSVLQPELQQRDMSYKGKDRPTSPAVCGSFMRKASSGDQMNARELEAKNSVIHKWAKQLENSSEQADPCGDHIDSEPTSENSR
jgi:hypothetical protein